MATGCQNMNKSAIKSSPISSINTYKISKLYYPKEPLNSNDLDYNNRSNITIEKIIQSTKSDNNNIIKEDLSVAVDKTSRKSMVVESNYSDLNQQQLDDYSNQKNLKIKTKSIENTLLPLVNQITTLVNFKDTLKPVPSSDNTINALINVGISVDYAVERFVQVGKNIAHENQNIKYDMLVACSDAKESGFIIKNHTTLCEKLLDQNSENIGIIRAANNLLDSVTKVLLLADVVIINQLLSSKNKVSQTINKLQNVVDFWNFINLFTEYGSDLIELAHLSGERQNDLKDEKLKSQLSSARWILEKSTAMILLSSKVYLKHLECECAKENLFVVYSFLQDALEIVNYVAVESGTTYLFTSTNFNAMFKASPVQISFNNAFKQFEDALDMSGNNLLMEDGSLFVMNALKDLIDSSLDFTESRYINNELRDRIIRLQNEIREKTLLNLKSDIEYKQKKNLNNKETNSTEDTNASNLKHNKFKSTAILIDCEILKKILQSHTMRLANSLFRENRDAKLLSLIKSYSATNNFDLLIQTLDKFKEYSDYVLELSRLLRHISYIDVFEVTCEHHYNVFEYLSKMIQSAASSAALYTKCISAMENLYYFCESWENQINALSVLVKEMQDSSKNFDIRDNRVKKMAYFSLPRPGKHGTNLRMHSTSKGSKLDQTEKTKMAKLGLEMKLLTNKIDVEANKWNEPQNEIVKFAKTMSEMAYEIHLFTRGEGSLKTTQDLFAKAQAFLHYSIILNCTIKDFFQLVPEGCLKNELILLLEKIPIYFKQLKGCLKQITIGKSATFNKVDCVIQETRNFMNLIAKLVTSCFLCSTKYDINLGNSNIDNNSQLDYIFKSGIYLNDKETKYSSDIIASLKSESSTREPSIDHEIKNNCF